MTSFIKQQTGSRWIILIVSAFFAANLIATNTWENNPEYNDLVTRIKASHEEHQQLEIGEIKMGDDKNYYVLSPLKEKHWLYYDTQNLYYTVVAVIDSTFSRGIEAGRDGDTYSDEIYLHLITQTESHLSYVYVFSPLGSKKDYTTDFSFRSNKNWNSNYLYRSEIQDNLWIIEAIIPFSDLRYSGVSPYKFSVMFRRTHRQSDSSYRYPHIDSRIGLNYYRSFYPIQIETKISHAWMQNLKIYTTAVYDLLNEHGNRLIDNTGLNFSIRPDKNSTARITIQPDFSDTPLDSESNVYNSKYPPMIEENRSFFIEDYDLLAARSDFWHTRQIINPMAAIKYNRTQDKSSLAILALKDKKYNYFAGSGDYWLASGYSRNIGSQQVIFNAYTRVSEDWEDHNSLGYLILGIRPWHRTSINPEFGLTYDRNSGFNKVGTYGKLAAAWQGDHLSVMGGYEYISRDFTARMGSINETDRSNLNAQIGYQRHFTGHVNSISSQLSVSDTYNMRFNENFYRSIGLSSSITTFDNTLAASHYVHNAVESFEEKKHSVFFSDLYLSLMKYSYIVPSLNLTYGKCIIYEHNITANYFSFTPKIWTMINQNTSLGMGAYYIKYNTILTDNFDNEYFLFNLNLQTRFVDKISITQGIRLNDYKSIVEPATDTNSALQSNCYIGYYTNIEWKINYHINLIAGYKSRETRLRMLGQRHFVVDEQNLYIKVEYLFK